MRQVPDRTGRFSLRPHYKPEELDRECEQLVVRFLREKYGEAKFPISTDDLTVLVEGYVESLDLYADLSDYGDDVEGVTEFRLGEKPIVRISEKLATQDRRENRLRTTLSHELGHVHFHAYLWDMEPPGSDLLSRKNNSPMHNCRQNDILKESRLIGWNGKPDTSAARY